MLVNFSIKPSFYRLCGCLSLLIAVIPSPYTSTPPPSLPGTRNTHIQYGQHTQAAATHIPRVGLMNGPSLNYFVQISFRPLKKRSSLFIHFTFAPGLQYLYACKEFTLLPSKSKKAWKRKDRKRQRGRERQSERKKQFTQCT